MFALWHKATHRACPQKNINHFTSHLQFPSGFTNLALPNGRLISVILILIEGFIIEGSVRETRPRLRSNVLRSLSKMNVVSFEQGTWEAKSENKVFLKHLKKKLLFSGLCSISYGYGDTAPVSDRVPWPSVASHGVPMVSPMVKQEPIILSWSSMVHEKHHSLPSWDHITSHVPTVCKVGQWIWKYTWSTLA